MYVLNLIKETLLQSEVIEKQQEELFHEALCISYRTHPDVVGYHSYIAEHFGR